MCLDASVRGSLVQFECVLGLTVVWLQTVQTGRCAMDKLKGKLKMKSVVQKVMDTGDDRDLTFEDVARLILNAYEEEAHAKEEAFFKFFQKLLLEDENFVGQLQPQEQQGVSSEAS
uniref:Uncharacterized protein n=1 Tax=Anopheles melas TaxID=34690 RepID=A0A182UGU3_9DIPT